MPLTVGSSTASDAAQQPAFYFDFASPEAYLAAERVLAVRRVPTPWVPIHLPPTDAAPINRAAIEARAVERGLLPVRWPAVVPFDSAFAMRAATYAQQIGRVVAFSLAAFRQAYAGGRDLSDETNVLVAGAACEMHPNALLKGADLRSTRAALDRATALARERGVRSTPALWTGSEVRHGDAALDESRGA